MEEICKYGVSDGYSYNRYSDGIKSVRYRHCKHKAKYIVTTKNEKTNKESDILVCERHKNDIARRADDGYFKLIKIEKIC